MLYEYRDLNNWVFEKQTAITPQQILYWFCAIRHVFHNTFASLRDHLDDELLNAAYPDELKIPNSDPLAKFSYYLAQDAILSWVNPNLNMQCITAQRKNMQELPRGIVLYNKAMNENNEPYVYIHYVVACNKGEKMGLGLLRSVMLEFSSETKFFLEVHKVNHSAIHLYEKLGFAIDTKPNIPLDFDVNFSHLMGAKSSYQLLASIPLKYDFIPEQHVSNNVSWFSI